MTCGRLAYLSASNTSTATIIAGSEVGIQHTPVPIYHPGPLQVYLGKAPDGVALEDIVGDELDFFKIASFTTTDGVWNRYETREVILEAPL